MGYFEHDADIGVIGCGATPEAAFVAAAEAMFGIMVNTRALRDERHIVFEFDETDLELAFVTWLNRLLAEARRHGLALCRFGLRRGGSRWLGEAWGQAWDDTIVPGTEVKGATLTMLSVRAAASGWEARCVVDV
ncbi:MAG: archease [Planctomycetota bacterium]|nr:archease [Planctomycetota bacterium]